ncbi:hypothetical protein Anas_07346, partial [Armadillidium nasatum]
VELVIGRLLYKVNILITLRRHSPLIRVLFGSFHFEDFFYLLIVVSKHWRILMSVTIQMYSLNYCTGDCEIFKRIGKYFINFPNRKAGLRYITIDLRSSVFLVERGDSLLEK